MDDQLDPCARRGAVAECPACRRRLTISPAPPAIDAVRCGCGVRSLVEWRDGAPVLVPERREG